MTNFKSKHVALLKNKIDCADVYCVTLTELQADRDAFIQNICLMCFAINFHYLERRSITRSKS